MNKNMGSTNGNIAPKLNQFEKAQQQYIFSLLNLGARLKHEGNKKVTVIILSYKRMKNIQRILLNILLCDFVDRIIISNNNPEIDLSKYIPFLDKRIELIQHKIHKGPSYRYDIARQYESEYYICIDDDVFPSPWQLLQLFEALLHNPKSPVGSTGQIFNQDLKPSHVNSRTIFPGKLSRTVDVILHVYVFTKAHLERYFDLVKAIGETNENIISSEDVIISFSGDQPARFIDSGYIAKCSTSDDPEIATWQRNNFWEYRMNLYKKMQKLSQK